MSPQPLTKEEKDRLYATKTYILTHLHEKLSTKQLARHALMGNKKLTENFIRYFGTPPVPFIREARMQMALFLLRHSDKSRKDIAAYVGFKQPGNFARAFKRYFGIPASAIRSST